ncbi:MAG: transcription elongation factor GreA [Acidimicrobiales bacterium]
MADSQAPHELSSTAYNRLKAEYDELVGAGRVDIAAKIEAARALGDLSENGDYHAAKEEQGKMEGRIRHLNALLQNAAIVDDTVRGEVVAVGRVVTIRFQGDDETEKFLIGSIEERHEDYELVSPGSPLGRALMGAAPGHVVSYEVSSSSIEVEIIALD